MGNEIDIVASFLAALGVGLVTASVAAVGLLIRNRRVAKEAAMKQQENSNLTRSKRI